MEQLQGGQRRICERDRNRKLVTAVVAVIEPHAGAVSWSCSAYDTQLMEPIKVI